jgi:HEAT repeat protein
LKDREPRVRAAAAKAIGDLGDWPSAGTLDTLLQDPFWDVRREAGMALHALGGPGHLLLCSSLSDPNPDAVDTARLVLHLPDPAEPAAKS